MPNWFRLTYANVVSTAALFLALGGGAAYAANKIQSRDLARNAVRSANLAPGAVRTSKVLKRAITSGKIGVGAVRSNQIANGAVGAAQVGSGAIAPSNLQFPVDYSTSPSGGPAPVSPGSAPYPLANGTWTQVPGEIDVIFGAAVATLAYDESGPGSCRVFFQVSLNGQQVGGGEVSTDSTTLKRVEQSIGAQPQIDPVTPTANKLTITTESNGACAPESTIDSARLRVLAFG
jgi:hypothetical protein